MSKPKPLWIIAAIIFYLGLLILGYIIGHGCVEVISVIAVSLTGLAVLWYSWETALLRHATYKQVENQIRPFIVIIPGLTEFRLQNIGSGSALNIKVQDVIIDKKGEGHLGDCIVRVDEIVPYLKPGDTCQVPVKSFQDGKDVDTFFSHNLDPKLAINKVEIHVEYSNVEMKKYIVSEWIGWKEFSILGFKE